MNVPFAIPDLGNQEIQEVISVIKSGWLTTASRCKQFEENFAKYVGAKHALAVNSATAALHLGVESMGADPDTAVLVPTFTFTSTAEVVRYFDAEPIFVDCEPDTFCISSDLIEQAYDHYKANNLPAKKIKIMIPVHFGGHPCEMNDIVALAKKYGLKIIEDAAHAIPTRYAAAESLQESNQIEGKLIGNTGDITCFSFYANKTMTTGEGGMLCTDNDDIAKRVQVMRLHGISRDVWDRFETGASWEYDIVAPGYKYNMPDISAAIGIHQLKKVEQFRDQRQKIAQIYFDELKNIPGLILPRLKCPKEFHSWYLFMVLINPEASKNGLTRDDLITELSKRNIGTSVHYKPLHRMSYYKNRYKLKPEMFPNAEWVFQRCVSLPMFSAMKENQLEYVIESIKEILL
ncbi:DegT/DnrJ/EryC1/StrS family aminotransferase [Desulfobacula toluolica]|uniref:ArnB: predicted UDP-4-amino-4-deoxy-L-arabinose--oxoglutarate aminotransferase n=1 Tax=Desulfobacula toluolica (strain DSM 7467 / Tol2) TaxID=651182 RepID=K0NDK7_DESTT|nr:DegT/DnrJ/EryC1/StrS family aminotransferase [Desulfobacula toluolica]CCK78976.1 ArnB: predicted UDP-4-amino-4-deoxy-L-arabinose--oxoglutarate aminotransferase [Desulfobacula toluolica Tol2]